VTKWKQVANSSHISFLVLYSSSLDDFPNKKKEKKFQITQKERGFRDLQFSLVSKTLSYDFV